MTLSKLINLDKIIIRSWNNHKKFNWQILRFWWNKNMVWNAIVFRKLNENPSPRTVPGLPEKVYSMKAKKCLPSVKNEVAMKVFEYYNKLNLIWVMFDIVNFCCVCIWLFSWGQLTFSDLRNWFNICKTNLHIFTT